MCELFALSACEPVRVRYDLDRFAAEGGELHRNRDGWGLALVDGRDAHYFREAAPASDSALDAFVNANAKPHACAIAHVRRATRGARVLANTHPFRRVMRGRVQHFAHNGELAGLEELPEAAPLLGERVGDTDSELAFLILLRRLRSELRGTPELRARFSVFRGFCSDMARLGPANFLWLDGDTLFAHADRRRRETERGLTEAMAPGLHVLQSRSGSVHGAHHCAGARIERMCEDVVLLASLPLSDGPWQPLEQGTALAIEAGRVVLRSTPLAPARAGNAPPR